MTFTFALVALAQATPLPAEPANAPTPPIFEPHDEWVAQRVPEPLTDEEACAMFKDRIQQLALQAPLKISAQKYRLRGSVDCPAKRFQVEEESTVTSSGMIPEWKEIEQSVWNGEFCNNFLTLPLTWRNWQFLDNINVIGIGKFEFYATCK